jgi:hypothetical protein
MLRDFNTILTQIDGKRQLVQNIDGQLVPVNFADMAIIALTTETEKESNQFDGPTKFRRFRLAQKIDEGRVNKTPVEISEQEAEMIRTAVAPQFVSLVVGQFYEFLEAK